MSYIPGLLIFIILLMLPGFFVAYLLPFRSRIWGSIVLSAGLVMTVFGWLAAFSLAGLILVLVGTGLLGAGLEALVLAGRAPGRNTAA